MRIPQPYFPARFEHESVNNKFLNKININADVGREVGPREKIGFTRDDALVTPLPLPPLPSRIRP